MPAAFAGLPRALLYVLVFNTVVAVLLTAAGFGGDFGHNLVYSQCIGLAMLFSIHTAWHLLWPEGRPPAVGMLALLAIAVPVAWLAGSALAAALLGQPWRSAISQGGLAVLMITAAAGIVGTFFFWTRGRLAQIGAHAAQAELRMLQAQIEPHFLFNTLANLDALIASDPPRARVMLGHLNDYLRATLAAARRERHTLREEFALLSGYLELLAIRMGPRLAFTLELPEALAAEPLPPMLLQLLVENAIKHGLERKVGGGRVMVRAALDGRKLVLTVEDDGLGLGASRSAGGGVGVAHLRERLAALYGGVAALELRDNSSGGVTATITLPEATHAR